MEKSLIKETELVYYELKKLNIKCKIDDRDNYNPGWKFNHWELKGVPIRVEFGMKDFKKGQMTIFTRDNGKKVEVKISDVRDYVIKELDVIQRRMYEKAKDGLNSMKKEAHDFNTFYDLLCKKNILLTPHCTNSKCEEDVLEHVKAEAKKKIQESGKDDDKDKFAASAKTLCIPLQQEPIKDQEKCFFCKGPAKKRVLWGKSY